jgi:cardiolipin synthase
MGGFGKTSRAFWKRLSAGGVEVRCYNPPRFDSPLGWVSRDHRKMISVDRTIAFVTGLCVGQMWVGDPGRHLDPWRDTGVEVRGPAVADIEHAVADAWAAAGRPLEDDLASAEVSGSSQAAEDDGADVAAMRVVATVPNTAGCSGVDQLVAALAHKTLWLTDAYYAGTTPYVQALRAAAADSVDVRLLVPVAAISRRCARSQPGIGRSSKPGSACSSGTDRCCTQDCRSRWQMGAGGLGESERRQLVGEPRTRRDDRKSRS